MTEEKCRRATKDNADYVKSWVGEDAASRLSEIVAREEEEGLIGFVHGSHAGCEKCGAKSMSMEAARVDHCLLSALLVCSSCDAESVLMVVGLEDDTTVVKMFPAEGELEDEDEGEPAAVVRTTTTETTTIRTITTETTSGPEAEGETVRTITTETTLGPEAEGEERTPVAPNAEACDLELRLLEPSDLCGKCEHRAEAHRNYPQRVGRYV